MASIGYFILFILYTVFLTSAMMMFSGRADARPYFWERVTGCFFISVILCAVMAFILNLSPKTGMYVYAIISAYAVISIFICFKSALFRNLYSICSGLLLRNSFAAIVKILQVVFKISDQNNFDNIPYITIIYIATGLIIYIPSWFIFIKHINKNTDFIPSMTQVITMLILVLIVFGYFGRLERYILAENLQEYITLNIINSVLCLLLLIIIYSAWHNAQTLAVKTFESELRKTQIEQLKNYNEVINAVNIKVHDLKHQVYLLDDFGGAKNRIIEDLKNTIDDYEVFINTGNDMLDAVLTEKNLRCNINKIDFSLMIDGKHLSFMLYADLNALFANALDNAIEYLVTMPENKRFLSVLCLRSNDLIKIRFENYFSGTIKFDKNGLPLTTKENTLYHGFGTRSIRAISEKYGGSAVFTTDENTFSISIVLPVKE